MKTHFYERSAYKLSEQPVPSCFIKLDDYFDQRLGVIQANNPHVSVVFAESLCARMADVEMYAFLIEDARKRHGLEQGNDAKAAILTRSFFLSAIWARSGGSLTVAQLRWPCSIACPCPVPNAALPTATSGINW